MSLNFRLTEIAGCEALCHIPDPDDSSKKVLNPVTQNIVFATMNAGIGHITEKNYIEFFLRIRASDAMSPWPAAPSPIKLEDVKAHIGLRTNVIDEPRAKWCKRIFEADIREIEYRQRRDAKVAA